MDGITLHPKLPGYVDPKGIIMITDERIIFLGYRKDLNEIRSFLSLPFSHVEGVYISGDQIGVKRVVTVVKKEEFIDQHHPTGKQNVLLMHRKKHHAHKTYEEIVENLERVNKIAPEKSKAETPEIMKPSELKCPSCGHKSPDNAKFCIECGQSLQ